MRGVWILDFERFWIM